ncbi:protoporphyrinogen oxidase isoform X2 [Lingula anatina]|nr:protoporphyrinogen oxidase isoform X2 [Lingula anatina]XP_013416459.1 protoporphyrinogen oxidase isoform X2 [Lingula anatina]XP_013416460.1 protoporphyrinogen oxidase isoform X2 [Lingula anatina]|eukprot:XP_013416457.1 protoporphyrinogen oxidase isoform X2 [Lingula anatina]
MKKTGAVLEVLKSCPVKYSYYRRPGQTLVAPHGIRRLYSTCRTAPCGTFKHLGKAQFCTLSGTNCCVRQPHNSAIPKDNRRFFSAAKSGKYFLNGGTSCTGRYVGYSHFSTTSGTEDRTVVIIGGGISGLTAAYYLTKVKNLPFDKIVLYESSDRLGGWINSLQLDDGTIFEQGPRTIRSPTATPAARATIELVESLGLVDDVIAVTSKEPAAKNRYIYVDGKLHALPNSLFKTLSKQSPFSKSLAHYVFKEMSIPAKSTSSDESVYDFFSRRFGAEVTNYAIGALCRGIYAADTKLLSMKACFPSLLEAENKYGSVIKGILGSLTEKTKPQNVDSAGDILGPNGESRMLQRAKNERWSVWSLQEGLSQLPVALASELKRDHRVDVQLNTCCKEVNFRGSKAIVQTEKGCVEADYIFSSIYAKTLSQLLTGVSKLNSLLHSIQAVTVAVVNLEYSDLEFKVEGFGHLVPPDQPSNVIGVIYDSCSFPDRVVGNRTVFTCMLGGTWFKEQFGDPDKVDPDYLTSLAISALQEQLGITQPPCRTYIGIQKDCIPLYRVGHTEVVHEIFQQCKEASLPLSLLGSSYKGVGVPDCIFNAKQEVIRIVKKINSN